MSNSENSHPESAVKERAAKPPSESANSAASSTTTNSANFTNRLATQEALRSDAASASQSATMKSNAGQADVVEPLEPARLNLRVSIAPLAGSARLDEDESSSVMVLSSGGTKAKTPEATNREQINREQTHRAPGVQPQSGHLKQRINPERKEAEGSPERRYNGRCSPERLSGETSRQDRRELAAALAHVLSSKLCEGRSVYLDGLGVLFPDAQEVPRVYPLGAHLAVRKESIVKLKFERAGELSPFIRERYHEPVEVAEFSPDVYRNLPLVLQLAWTNAQMRFYLSGLISLLRREIVLDGFSHRLAPFCSFFSLHNRHGDSTVDWFAGADIFVHSDFEHLKRVEQPKLMERARFASMQEFGEVALGTPQHTFPLNIPQAVNDIGMGASRSFYPEVEVIVLERAPGRLAFLTSGARHVPRKNGEQLGVELVLDCVIEKLAAWPFTVLAATIEALVSDEGPIEHSPLARASGSGCIALPQAAFGSPMNQAAVKQRSGSGAESSVSVGLNTLNSGTLNTGARDSEPIWSGALVSQVVPNGDILLENETSVRVFWITPLQEAEMRVAERRTPDHAAALLSRRGLMHTTRLNRASVLFRTVIL